jgi:hypothetical protein
VQKRRLGNWLDEYMHLTENTEPPVLFRLWTGISTIAAVLQRKCWGEWEGNIYPNLYVVLVGPSGCRKGTAMRPSFRMLKKIGIKMAAEAITREALIRELKGAAAQDVEAETLYMHASLTIYSQELTVFLGYQNMALIGDLTDWFDCRDQWTYRTKNMGTDDIDGVWVNLIGATTPDALRTALPDDAIGIGLTSRMILVYADKKAKRIPEAVMTQDERDLEDLLYQDLEIIHLMKGEFKRTREYVQKYVSWYEEEDETPPEHLKKDKFFAGYCERRSLHLRKLSMICSAARSSEMILTGEDFDRALLYLRQTEKMMPEVYSGRGKSKFSEIIQNIARIIAARKVVYYQELLELYYKDLDRMELDRIVQTLCTMGLCRAEVSAKGTKLVYNENFGKKGKG